ncbi:hypothetical protein CLV30_10235 [Haloactinopolyspora alba]|uniref:KANL3/Tex30 alpha/beta hydrolase-like domain-containing protein n=1 Tax=Haloactinopolyspora alba TaxID=648780 RepID=A0A2P8EB15_9ACTN|nr:alpha/beta family hydrolase [Haloactinopolyspora alba]PSL06650.1 hypothetical protein CLV30_10235 [Haloactinopolyspora alba]
MTERTTVPTPVGDARLWTDEPDEADAARARLVLGHGAGGGPDAADLRALAERLPEAGVSVVRVEQPWRVAGKRVAPRPATLDEAWLVALDAVARDVPMLVGGRSAGARVACRTAEATGAAGVVALSFPLHPPGKPERSRQDELLTAAAAVPTLVVQGERDTFGRPGEFPDGPYRLVAVDHADHAMAVPKAHDRDAATAAVVEAVRSFVLATVSSMRWE